MKTKHPLIMGKNCIREAISSTPERIIKVFTLSGNSKDSLYQEIQSLGIAIEHCAKQDLTKLVNSDSHQFYIAAVKQRQQRSVQEFVKGLYAKEASVVIMLDSIFDPHNLGAILRAAECFGADGVIYSKNRGTDITPSAAKVSSGASELISVIKVSNLAETAALFQQEGFYLIAADAGEGAESIYNMKFPPKTLLILGSEGEGIQPLLKKRSDILVKIPMFGKIDSLNVSQAAAVFLYAYRYCSC